ncbi:MAG: 23S rRNA (uracil(1939)-C(5))-methyltransferase, partial [Pseudomonadota bacterium]
MSRRRSKIGTIGCTTITELDAKGRGVGVFRDRPIHVPATLPGEDIRFRISGQRRRAFEGELVDLYRPAGNRVRSHCAHFFSCGGCSFQHLDIEAQRALKMAHLRAQFDAVGVALPPLSPPIVGPDWGYRRSARLAA